MSEQKIQPDVEARLSVQAEELHRGHKISVKSSGVLGRTAAAYVIEAEDEKGEVVVNEDLGYVNVSVMFDRFDKVKQSVDALADKAELDAKFTAETLHPNDLKSVVSPQEADDDLDELNEILDEGVGEEEESEEDAELPD